MKHLNKIRLGIILLSFVILSQTTYGQVTIEPKSTFLNAGVGFQGTRFHTSTWKPSVNAGIEYAIVKDITAGIDANYYGEQFGKNFWFRSYSAGVRGSYYFNTLLKRTNRKNNYYVGFGVMFYNYKYTDFEATKGRLYIPVHIGAKRLIYKNYGANVQLAFNDMGFIKVGLFTKLQ